MEEELIFGCPGEGVISPWLHFEKCVLPKAAITHFIIYQSSKFSFSFVSLVESVSREIDEIRLSPSHQRAREIMHYSPVNNKKITCAFTGTRDLSTAENRECFVNDILYRIKFKVFQKINKIFHVFSYEVRSIFSFL